MLDLTGSAPLTYRAHVEGTASSDTLNGTSGTDAIFGLAGNDTIFGGDGDDTLMLSGNFAQYTITQAGSTLKIVASGVINDVSDIEHLHFADQTVHVADPWPPV